MRHKREDGNSPKGKDTLNTGPAQAGESLFVRWGDSLNTEPDFGILKESMKKI